MLNCNAPPFPLSSQLTRMMALEHELEEVQAEVLDMQRAMVKVQTW